MGSGRGKSGPGEEVHVKKTPKEEPGQGSVPLPHSQAPNSSQLVEFLSPGGHLRGPKIDPQCSYTHVVPPYAHMCICFVGPKIEALE